LNHLKSLNEVFVSIGSNLDKERHVPAAVAELSRHLPVLAASSAYETASVGPPGQPTYLNAAVLVQTKYSPATFKHRILRTIEQRQGRRRSADRFAPRTLDLDITLWNRECFELEGKSIPDPDLLIHLHLALPVAEIAPHFVHPVSGETLATIARRLQAHSA
jgi:2-amino-4-hydroxy-6-hydroxymethyldihydropteridine diphosphokinase